MNTHTVSLRALRNPGAGIAKLVTHTDPQEHVIALARYARSREPSNLVGLHLYSFGGGVRTSMRHAMRSDVRP